MKIVLDRRSMVALGDDDVGLEALALFDAMAEGREELLLVWDALAALWLSHAHPWVRELLGLRVVARGADLRGADLRGANLSQADLREADLRGAELAGASLQRANLRDADLRGAGLRGAYLNRADLRGANLRGADLRGADLVAADLRGETFLMGADLRGADLRGAEMSFSVELCDALLNDADLRRADLREADLTGADLTGALRSTFDPALVGWVLHEGHLLRTEIEGSPRQAPDANAELREVLEGLIDADPARRAEALTRLKRLYVRCDEGGCTISAETATAALPYARGALTSPDAGVRVTGAEALGLLAPDAEGELVVLAAALDDPAVEVRVAAIEALGEFGATAAPFAARVRDRLVAATTAEEREATVQLLINMKVEAEPTEVPPAAGVGSPAGDGGPLTADHRQGPPGAGCARP